MEKLDWYGLRWKVEVFRKFMKSGYDGEKGKLLIARKLVKFLALMTVAS
ncbi:hypothetical protein ACLBXB_28120 [Methylobacterium mesophilicum]